MRGGKGPAGSSRFRVAAAKASAASWRPLSLRVASSSSVVADASATRAALFGWKRWWCHHINHELTMAIHYQKGRREPDQHADHQKAPEAHAPVQIFGFLRRGGRRRLSCGFWGDCRSGRRIRGRCMREPVRRGYRVRFIFHIYNLIVCRHVIVTPNLWQPPVASLKSPEG